MKTRLQYIITNEGLTNIRFAELLGVNPASISHILAERNKPSFDFIVKIAENLPQYNLRWLLTGKGEPITSPVNMMSIPSPAEATSPEKASLTEISSLPQNGDCAPAPNSNNDTKSEAPPVMTKNTPTSKLIVCFPDGTFEEFSRR
ncbi:MAG: helix-turn-helix domain-containing protein [Rikenellaceae bacterium]|nr:helix-turn-helix domain-containing protein [Rikenellaceae bacterium]